MYFFYPVLEPKINKKILADLHAHAVRNINKISRQNMKKILWKIPKKY